MSAVSLSYNSHSCRANSHFFTLAQKFRVEDSTNFGDERRTSRITIHVNFLIFETRKSLNNPQEALRRNSRRILRMQMRNTSIKYNKYLTWKKLFIKPFVVFWLVLPKLFQACFIHVDELPPKKLNGINQAAPLQGKGPHKFVTSKIGKRWVDVTNQVKSSESQVKIQSKSSQFEDKLEGFNSRRGFETLH